MFEHSSNAYLYQYRVSNVFMHLFFGLFLAGIVSYAASTSILFMKYYTTFILIWLVASVILAFIAPFFARNSTISLLIYYIYCLLEGFGLSSIFLVYTKTSIALALISTALICLGLSIVARNNIVDLRNVGFALFVATLVGFVLSLIEIFLLHSTLFSAILNFAFLILFSLWFIYDLQNMEDLINQGISSAFIALMLFIDVIGIFLNLLELIGSEK